MTKRLLSLLIALSLSLRQVAPALAGHNEPVVPAQAPFALQRSGDTSSGVQTYSAPAAIDLSQAGTPNPTISKLTSGIGVSFCPALSCVNSPSDQPTTPTPSFFDHQRASLLLSGATRDDGHSEEQTLAVATTIGTGYSKPYAASTAYSVGDNVNVGNAVYRAVVAGTTGANSAPPGTRPTAAQGGAYQVIDGSVTWQWINDAAINAKVGSYFETKVVAGAGAAWGAAFNYHFTAPPKAGMFLPGVEMDYSNDSGTACALGTTDCTALRLAMAGSPVTEGLQVTGNAGASVTTTAAVASGATTIPVSSTAGLVAGQSVLYGNLPAFDTIASVGTSSITVSNGPGAALASGTTVRASTFSSIWAARINGDFIASQSALEIDAAAPVGLSFGGSGIGGATHSSSTIADSSTSPTTLNIGGKHSLASIYDSSTSQNGIALNGTYAGAQVIGKNWKVDPSGNSTVAQEAVTSTTASTSTTTGALTVAGGLGVAGAANVGGALNANGAIAGANITPSLLFLSGASGAYRQVIGQTSGSTRWDITLGNNASESGSNVGSDFAIDAYGDNGAYLGSPILITRATQTVSINSVASVLGQLTVKGGTGSGNNAGVPAIVFSNYNTSGAGPNLIGSGSGVAQSGIGIGSNSDTDIYSPSLFRFYANGTLVHSVDNAGNASFAGKLQEPLSTPASSSATCTAGQIWADATYVYVCTAANVQKRVALATF